MSEIHPESSAVVQCHSNDSSKVDSLQRKLKYAQFTTHTAIVALLGVISLAVLRDVAVQKSHEVELITSRRDLLKEVAELKQNGGVLEAVIRDLKSQLNNQQQPQQQRQRVAVPLALAHPIEEPEKQNLQDVIVEDLPHLMTPEERVRRAVTDQALKMRQHELNAQQQVRQVAQSELRRRKDTQSTMIRPFFRK